MLRVLLVEEVTGRDAATQRMRRKAAGFPAVAVVQCRPEPLVEGLAQRTVEGDLPVGIALAGERA